MRKLCTVQTVKKVSPIEGADFIEEIEILGWHLVAKKGEFEVGSKAIFFEIDSLLKPIEAYAFMEVRKYRVKTARFKSIISQGLALPLTILTEEGVLEDGWKYIPEAKTFTSVLMNVKLEDDVDLTDILGIEKYDLEEGESLQSVKGFKINPKKSKIANKIAFWKYKIKVWINSFSAKSRGGNFPTHLCPKTDEKRLQSYSQGTLESLVGKSFSKTVKMDGSSGTYIKHKKDFFVCSRNLKIGENNQSNFWKIAYKYDLKNKMKSLKRNLALQMEVIGDKIQGNRYKITGLEVRLFKVYDIDKRKYLPISEMVEIAKKLEIPHVYVDDFNFIFNHTVDELVELSTRKSVENSNTQEEGFVYVLNDDEKNLSFKVINPLYLLEKDGKEKKEKNPHPITQK